MAKASEQGRTCPKAGFQDLARIVSESWKNLDEETRAEFHELARIDKERYVIEKADWQAAVAELEQVHSAGSLPGSSGGSNSLSRNKINKKARRRMLGNPNAGMKQDRALGVVTKKKAVTKAIVLPARPQDEGTLEPFSLIEMKSLANLSSQLDPESRQFLINTFS